MNEESIRDLIAGGEMLTVEFKSDHNNRGQPLDDRELLETVVCLANTQGGTLLLGVEDDGVVTGLHSKHVDSPPNHVAALIANRTVPSLTVQVEFSDLSEGRIAIISVSKSPQIISTTDGKVLKRVLDAENKPQCKPLYPTDYLSWYTERGQYDATARVIEGTTWNDLDKLEFARLRRLLNEYRGDAALMELSDEELARALGFVRPLDLVPTLAGLLIVGSEEVIKDRIPTHEVAFQVLRGQDVAVNEFYRWPLLRIFERLIEAFSVRNEETEITVDLFRVGIPAYDQRAFREAVNNSLTHRDYSRIGAVYVQFYEDVIVIRNPGGFVEGIQLNNLLNSGPLPRNPLLADIFKRLGLVERTGRGIGLMYTGQLRWGHMPPDYSQSTQTSVTLRLVGGEADIDFVKLVMIEEKRLQRRFSLEELLVLNVLRHEGEISILETGTLIQKPENEARRVLERLREDGLLERTSAGRHKEYMFSAAMYRLIGRPDAYIRRRGFESIQMEQMVIQYVTIHGRITRSGVSALCKITGPQAAYLLRKLVQKGMLRSVGSRGRYVYYVLSNREDVEEDKRVTSPQYSDQVREGDVQQLDLGIDLKEE